MIPSTVYSSVNPPKVSAMSVIDRRGELAWAVFMRPYTIQGCRPISVNSQPNVLARNGAAMQATRRRRVQRRTWNAFGDPRRDSHRAHAETASISRPSPTMSRKLQ